MTETLIAVGVVLAMVAAGLLALWSVAVTTDDDPRLGEW